MKAASLAAAFVVVLAAASPALAQSPGEAPDILTADEVLQSSAEHAPAILEALARSDAARGDELAARGAFDLVFDAGASIYTNGYYDGRYVGATATQPLGPLGGSIYGGYRVSRGDFPIYDDYNFTNESGETKIGVLFSLLRDRDIDARRFGVRDTQLAARQAELDALFVQLGVQHRALTAYWRWVAAGRQLEVYEDLLRLAEDRQRALERQVASGARAEIFLTENLQNILRRRTLVTSARREFGAAAIDLSFYFRNADGQGVTPSKAMLPPPQQIVAIDVAPDAAENALSRRPELETLRIAIDRARNELALEKNALAPTLDLRVEASRDWGPVGEGGVSRDATDTIVGLEFSVPLQRRAARGGAARAAAEAEALRQRRRVQSDQIENEVRAILMDLDITQELAEIARDEVRQAETMRRAEVRRFESGASDFFVVNLREEAAADARIRGHLADFAARRARADYFAAIVDTGRLGLSPSDGS